MIANQSADLAVVVVSYNSQNVILEAIESLVDQPGITVVLVDNASSDSTVELVRTQFPSVQIIALDRNLGFAKAVNLGITSCSSPNVMLLNPDAVIGITEVRVLLSKLHGGSGIVAPLIVDPGSRLQIVSAGHFPTIWRMLLHFSGIARFSKNVVGFQGHYLFPGNLKSEPTAVGWVTGACMLFTKETWRAAGGLSERWFMYAEDIDFCYRVKSQGQSVDLIAGVKATHLVGQSDSTASFTANPAWVVNLHDFYCSALSPSKLHSLVWCLVVGVGLLSRSLLFQLRGGVEGPESYWLRESARFRIFALAVLRRSREVLRRVDGD